MSTSNKRGWFVDMVREDDDRSPQGRWQVCYDTAAGNIHALEGIWFHSEEHARDFMREHLVGAPEASEGPPPATWWGICSECRVELANEPIEPHAPECSYWDTFDLAVDIIIHCYDHAPEHAELPPVRVAAHKGDSGAHSWAEVGRALRERYARHVADEHDLVQRVAKRSNERSVSSSQPGSSLNSGPETQANYSLPP